MHSAEKRLQISCVVAVEGRVPLALTSRLDGVYIT